MFINFYQQLLHTEGIQGLSECLTSLVPRVTLEMNAVLLKDFIEVEVDVALAQMHPFKSPGPDKFLACFYP